MVLTMMIMMMMTDGGDSADGIGDDDNDGCNDV